MRLFGSCLCFFLLFLSMGCQKSNNQPPQIQTLEMEPNKTKEISSPAVEDDPTREKIENAQYQTWSRFKPGTVVITRDITENTDDPRRTIKTITTTLKEVTDTHVTIVIQADETRYDGVKVPNPPAEFKHMKMLLLPPGVKKADVLNDKSILDQGEEEIEVNGNRYQTKWHKSKSQNEAGDVFVTTWNSDKVPGGLVKSIMETPSIKKRTTIELVKITTP